MAHQMRVIQAFYYHRSTKHIGIRGFMDVAANGTASAH
jgi:hypothetical protein